ncbi:MAG: DUF488 family protein [Bacteroidia bacterium]
MANEKADEPVTRYSIIEAVLRVKNGFSFSFDMEKTIWTIGHSTRTADDFLKILAAFGIELLVDVRRFPASRRLPHFSRTNLENFLEKENIAYKHIEALGGMRKPLKDSKNTAWKNASFRGYADYMETPVFDAAIVQLEELALQRRTAYMCAEAVWWSCHRALISDYLKTRGWTVIHITSAKSSMEHPYTKAAKLTKGRLDYTQGITELNFPGEE